MKLYTVQEIADIKGVGKPAVLYKIHKLGIGKKTKQGIFLLTEEEVKSLVFRAKNKKRYIYNLQRKEERYKKSFD